MSLFIHNMRTSFVQHCVPNKTSARFLLVTVLLFLTFVAFPEELHTHHSEDKDDDT